MSKAFGGNRSSGGGLPVVNMAVKACEGNKGYFDVRLDHDAKAFHAFRMIPAVNDENQIEDPFDSTANCESLEGVLGSAFAVVETFEWYVPNKGMFRCISDVIGSRDGTPAPRGWSPIKNWQYRMSWKLKTLKWLLEKNQTGTEHPSTWDTFIHKTLGDRMNVYDAIYVQGMFLALNGKPILNNEGKASWLGPYVYKLPKKPFMTLVDATVKNRDLAQPLSCAALQPEDDWISCARGRQLRISPLIKAKEEKSDGKDKKPPEYVITLGRSMPLKEETVVKLWRPWSKLINFMTIEDQIEFIFRLMGPEALDYGLRGTDYYDYVPRKIGDITVRGSADFIPDETRKKVEIDALPKLEKSNRPPDAATERPSRPVPSVTVGAGKAPAQAPEPVDAEPAPEPAGETVSEPAGEPADMEPSGEGVTEPPAVAVGNADTDVDTPAAPAPDPNRKTETPDMSDYRKRAQEMVRRAAQGK